MTKTKWGGVLLLAGLALFTDALASPRSGVFLFTLALAFCAARLFERMHTNAEKGIFLAVPLVPALLLFANGPLYLRLVMQNQQKVQERLAVLTRPFYLWLLIGLVLGLWLMPAVKAFAKTAPKCAAAVVLVLAELLVTEPLMTAVYHARIEFYRTEQMHQLVPLLIGFLAAVLYKVMKQGKAPFLRKGLLAAVWVVFALSMVHSWFADPGWAGHFSLDFYLNVPFAAGTVLGVLYALPAEAER